VALWPPPVSHLPAGGNGSLVAPRGVRAPYAAAKAVPLAPSPHGAVGAALAQPVFRFSPTVRARFTSPGRRLASGRARTGV